MKQYFINCIFLLKYHMNSSSRCRQPSAEEGKVDFDNDCCAGTWNLPDSVGSCTDGYLRSPTKSCGHGSPFCDQFGCVEYTCTKSTSCVEFVGCYKDRKDSSDSTFKSTKFHTGSKHADGYRVSAIVSACSNSCRGLNYSFAAVQGADTCWCGDTDWHDKYERVEDQLCGWNKNKGMAMSCGDGNSQTCTGVNSVYHLNGQWLVHFVFIALWGDCKATYPLVHHWVTHVAGDIVLFCDMCHIWLFIPPLQARNIAVDTTTQMSRMYIYQIRRAQEIRWLGFSPYTSYILLLPSDVDFSGPAVPVSSDCAAGVVTWRNRNVYVKIYTKKHKPELLQPLRSNLQTNTPVYRVQSMISCEWVRINICLLSWSVRENLFARRKRDTSTHTKT